jgi:hypothetical protein
MIKRIFYIHTTYESRRLWQGFFWDTQNSLQGFSVFLFLTQADFDPPLFSRVQHAAYS